LRALEVTWIHDALITPPGPKMVVCVEPDQGFFFRINTDDNYKPCVRIERLPDHRWLDHDSHIECSVLDLDEYLIDEAVRTSGIIGVVSADVARPILATIQQARYISDADKLLIIAALEPLCA
jgi:hypothetical protein